MLKKDSIIVVALLVLIIFIRSFLFLNVQTSGIWEATVFSLIALLFLPYIVIKYLLKKPLREFNWFWPEYPALWKTAVLGGAALFGFLGILVLKFDWKLFVPVSFWVGGGLWLTLFLDLFCLLPITIANEFFFRGFLMNSIKKDFGKVAALIFQALAMMAYLFFLSGMPALTQFIGMVVLQIILGIIALHTKSIGASAVVNWLFLFIIDMMSIFVIAH